jgi:hypothetical protein
MYDDDGGDTRGVQLDAFARLYRRPWPADELLELVGLSEDAGTRIGALSGGQQRRVDVALGLVGRPEVLFLDEPTTGVQISSLSMIMALIPIGLGVLAWSALATLAAAFIPNASSAYPLLGATGLPVILLSGGLGSVVSTGSSWLNTLMSYLPAKPVIDGTARALRAHPIPPSAHDIAILAAWTIVAMLAAARCFTWSPTPPARRHPGVRHAPLATPSPTNVN